MIILEIAIPIWNTIIELDTILIQVNEFWKQEKLEFWSFVLFSAPFSSPVIKKQLRKWKLKSKESERETPSKSVKSQEDVKP